MYSLKKKRYIFIYKYMLRKLDPEIRIQNHNIIYIAMALSVRRICAQIKTLSPFYRSCSSVTSSEASRRDKLFDKIEVEIRAHQPDVLKSYSFFAQTAAKELNVNVLESVVEPEPHKVRKTLLRSAFVKKKHRVQYEFRCGFYNFLKSFFD